MNEKREERIKKYRTAFGLNESYVLKDLEKTFYFDSPTYVFDSKNPKEDTLVREGMRMVILHIHKIMKMKLKEEM
jgi:hypothetical protein